MRSAVVVARAYARRHAAWLDRNRAVVLIGLALALAVLGLECVRYVVLGAYLDHAEGNIAINAWEYAHGVPLYQLQAGAPRLANPYGPFAYLVELPALKLLGPGVMASKLAAMVALLATVGLMGFRFFRRSPGAGLHAAFFLAAGLLAFSPWSFIARPDSAETFMVALGVAVAAHPIALGLCLGVAVNLKAHATVYFLPLIVELAARRGWRAVAALVLASAIAFLAPFLLPNISFHDYLVTLIQQATGRPHTLKHIGFWIAFIVVLSLPIVVPLLQKKLGRENRLYIGTCFVSLILLLYLGTIPGPGPYHFLPLVPVLAEGRRRLPTGGIDSQLAMLPLLLVGLVYAHGTLTAIGERGRWGALADEAVMLAGERPALPTAIGYGDSERSYQIVELAKAKRAFRGSPPRIDAQILMELAISGVDGLRRWLPDVRDCRIPRWVLPRGEKPFAMGSYYSGLQPFDATFRAAFAANYRLVKTSPHFAVWECDKPR